MISLVQENGIIAAAAVLLVALVVWLLLRGRASRQAPARPQAPAAPLQPIKPEIVAAEPAHFSAAEPVAAMALPSELEAAPVKAEAAGPADNLALLKGVGPKLVALLASLGVTRFDQIAAWTDADVAAIDAQLGNFAGRVTRDNWVDQAGFLARGDKAGFEAKYGALGGEI